MLEIKIQINKCDDCKHKDHTGVFTKGGAKPCCNHPETVKAKGHNCFKRIIPFRTKEYLGTDCNVPKGIPNWCPLKNNKPY